MHFQTDMLVVAAIVTTLLLVTGCFGGHFSRTTAIPAVAALDRERYAGTWYEIARLPNRFERNLDCVTATYTLKADGEIEVLNKGFNTKKDEWSEIVGRAWVPDPAKPAHLKVSFFWIFASDYTVIALDEDAYSYAMVTSATTKYLWILSRAPTLDAAVYDRLVQQAADAGFGVERLYRVEHECHSGHD